MYFWKDNKPSLLSSRMTTQYKLSVTKHELAEGGLFSQSSSFESDRELQLTHMIAWLESENIKQSNINLCDFCVSIKVHNKTYSNIGLRWITCYRFQTIVPPPPSPSNKWTNTNEPSIKIVFCDHSSVLIIYNLQRRRPTLVIGQLATRSQKPWWLSDCHCSLNPADISLITYFIRSASCDWLLVTRGYHRTTGHHVTHTRLTSLMIKLWDLAEVSTGKVTLVNQFRRIF